MQVTVELPEDISQALASHGQAIGKSPDRTNVVHFDHVMKTESGKSQRSRSKSGRFVVERKGSDLFINGNRILDPAGKPSVKHSRLRAAVHKVAAKR